MKKIALLIGIVLLFVGASVVPTISAINEADDSTLSMGGPLRTIFWEDNFDSYDEGQDLHGVGGWKGWDNDPLWTAYVTADQAQSAPQTRNANF